MLNGRGLGRPAGGGARPRNERSSACMLSEPYFGCGRRRLPRVGYALPGIYVEGSYALIEKYARICRNVLKSCQHLGKNPTIFDQHMAVPLSSAQPKQQLRGCLGAREEPREPPAEGPRWLRSFEQVVSKIFELLASISFFPSFTNF